MHRKVIELERCHTKYSKTSSLSNAEGETTSKTVELACRSERISALFQSAEVCVGVCKALGEQKKSPKDSNSK
jgi:hypothetical protein